MTGAADNTVASSDSIKKFAILDGDGDLMHDATGGFNNCDVDGTKRKVYTKYLTGTLDADSSTTVAHGIADGITKILSVTAYGYEDTVYSGFQIQEFRQGANSGAIEIIVIYNGTNVVFDPVGTNLQGNAYRIKIDYLI
jgi:hypothetical protein